MQSLAIVVLIGCVQALLANKVSEAFHLLKGLKIHRQNTREWPKLLA